MLRGLAWSLRYLLKISKLNVKQLLMKPHFNKRLSEALQQRSVSSRVITPPSEIFHLHFVERTMERASETGVTIF